jgi:hypothetical protein
MVLFAVVRHPMVLRLPDGRNVVLAPVMPGDSHASTGFYAAFVLGSDQQQPFAMAEGSSFGAAGALSAPRQQPPGAFHVWLEGGGTWQGYTQAGPASQISPTPCPSIAAASAQRRFPVQARRRRRASRGATNYALTSIDCSDNGADELSLAWSLER